MHAIHAYVNLHISFSVTTPQNGEFCDTEATQVGMGKWITSRYDHNKTNYK